MGLLKRLVGKEDRFFMLLEACAQEGCASARALAHLLANPPTPSALAKIVKSRENEEAIHDETGRLLCESYSTPLEHEEIETLSRALYRIPKGTKKFAERYLLCAAHLQDVNFTRQMEMLETATGTVLAMVCELKKGRQVASAKAHNDTLQRIESEADELLALSLDQLYEGKHPALKAIILKDLYELLEKVFDRCRNAGNIILQIELRHS